MAREHDRGVRLTGERARRRFGRGAGGERVDQRDARRRAAARARRRAASRSVPCAAFDGLRRGSAGARRRREAARRLRAVDSMASHRDRAPRARAFRAAFRPELARENGHVVGIGQRVRSGSVARRALAPERRRERRQGRGRRHRERCRRRAQRTAARGRCRLRIRNEERAHELRHRARLLPSSEARDAVDSRAAQGERSSARSTNGCATRRDAGRARSGSGPTTRTSSRTARRRGFRRASLRERRRVRLFHDTASRRFRRVQDDGRHPQSHQGRPPHARRTTRRTRLPSFFA